MTRRQLHAYGLAGLGVLIIALCVALAMLGHATMSGAAQWAAGALAGVTVTASIVAIITIIVGAGLVGDEIADHRRSRAARQRPATNGVPPWAAHVIAKEARRRAILAEPPPPVADLDPASVARDRALIEDYGRPAARHGAPYVPMPGRPNPDPDPATLLDLEPLAAATRIEVWTAPVSDTAASAGLEDLYAHPGRQP